MDDVARHGKEWWRTWTRDPKTGIVKFPNLMEAIRNCGWRDDRDQIQPRVEKKLRMKEELTVSIK
jgi:hypothetical protein